MTRRTTTVKKQKPKKPTPDYPLYAHASGKWAKKFGKTVKYFGSWGEPEAALTAYREYIGHEPASPREGVEVAAKELKRGRRAAVKKPYPDFPLTPHPRGQWCKKIKGELRYFGPIEDWQAALDRYTAERDAWQAGRGPTPALDSIRLKELVNRFLIAKEHDSHQGRLDKRTFDDYNTTCGCILGCFAPDDPVVEQMQPDDFRKLEAHFLKGKKKRRGKVSLWNHITRARVLFKWAEDENLISHAVNYGKAFRRPSKKELRQERQRKQEKHGKKMFEVEQLRPILKAAIGQVKAMVLLGINCGFGNTDCATIPIQAFDLTKGWVHCPRTKTAVDRRCPLWPETVEAIQAALAKRKAPKDESYRDRLFLTKFGNTWAPSHPSDPITHELDKAMKKAGVEKRPGLSFYALRHTFRTIAGRSKDQIAVDFIMGHAPASDDMRAVYDEEMTDERLYAIVDYVRKWLFSKTSLPTVDGAAAPAVWQWSEVPENADS
jgi:integrase